MDYVYNRWERKEQGDVHQQIFDTIKGKPVFIHCWNGIHATGAVAAAALIQFCGMSSQKAVEYWKVGIAK